MQQNEKQNEIKRKKVNLDIFPRQAFSTYRRLFFFSSLPPQLIYPTSCGIHCFWHTHQAHHTTILSLTLSLCLWQHPISKSIHFVITTKTKTEKKNYNKLQIDDRQKDTKYVMNERQQIEAAYTSLQFYNTNNNNSKGNNIKEEIIN